MLKTEKLKDRLRSSVSRISKEQLEGTAGFASGGFRFSIPEAELKMMGFPVAINSETASDIFNIGIRQICRQMLESASVLSEEMLITACETIVKELLASEGQHLFVFFVPSIILAIDESIEIGGAILRKATASDTELLEKRENALLKRRAAHQGPLDKSDFLKRYLGSALVEVRFSGCHLKDELSFPGDGAWKAFRRVAGFLMACKELLQLPEAQLPEAYPDHGLDFSAWPEDAFMVAKHSHAPMIPMFCIGIFNKGARLCH